MGSSYLIMTEPGNQSVISWSKLGLLMELHHLHWSGLPFRFWASISSVWGIGPWRGSDGISDVPTAAPHRETRLTDPTDDVSNSCTSMIYNYIMISNIQYKIILYSKPICSTFQPGSISPVVVATPVQPTAGEHRHSRHGVWWWLTRPWDVASTEAISVKLFLWSTFHLTKVEADGAAYFSELCTETGRITMDYYVFLRILGWLMHQSSYLFWHMVRRSSPRHPQSPRASLQLSLWLLLWHWSNPGSQGFAKPQPIASYKPPAMACFAELQVAKSRNQPTSNWEFVCCPFFEGARLLACSFAAQQQTPC